MKELKIVWNRELYTLLTTIGKMFLVYDGKSEYFGYTLEDTVRPYGIKVAHYTALPAGVVFKVAVRESPKFGKTVIFYTEDDKETIKVGPLTWKYVLVHGGNDHEDTDACVLVAKNKTSNTTIQGALHKELVEFVEKKIAEGYVVTAEATNIPQLS